jgi:hypothetical protein
LKKNAYVKCVGFDKKAVVLICAEQALIRPNSD